MEINRNIQRQLHIINTKIDAQVGGVVRDVGDEEVATV